MIELAWPPATLSGHNKGSWHGKSSLVRKHREWAKEAAKQAGAVIPAEGDIRLTITFYPPNRRGDRCNFPIRVKPLIDGVAEGLGINDSRFLPSYHFAEPVKNARVVMVVGQ